MSRQDCNKQVEKRQRIKKKTLVVGMDIGSDFNAVALMSKEGEIFVSSQMRNVLFLPNQKCPVFKSLH
jgi:activator of 2-hydroxyglutaryl-CoA dehydratase